MDQGATSEWYRVARRRESCTGLTTSAAQGRKIRDLRAKVGGLEPIRFQEDRRSSEAQGGGAAAGADVSRSQAGSVVPTISCLYSAGDCPVCSDAGDALFVKDRASDRIFFLCPSCGCAWLSPPMPHKVETVDPPESFAPNGVALPSRTEIAAQGWAGAIARDVEADQWMESLRDFLILP